MKENKSGLLRSAQVAHIAGISERTVKKMAKDGELPCTFYNRQPLFDIKQLFEHFEYLERSAV